MCTLLLAIEQHPRYPLILAANRDEFYDRPAAAASFWDDAPDLFAGRDLRRGGTWLGVSRGGRIAALTNYREPHLPRDDAPSRGLLVSDFLLSPATVEEYVAGLRRESLPYSGYNLLFGQWDRLCYYSNKSDRFVPLGAGVYGLSNHLLDTPWPKVERGKQALRRLLDAGEFSAEDLFALLADRTKAPDAELPDTGVGLERERLLSSIFIASERYGTRSSTVLMVDRERQATFTERSFDAGPFDVRGCFDWR